MPADAARWLFDHNTRMADWPIAEVVQAKRSAANTVSVVVPARDEQATIGPIVSAIRSRLMEATSLVDDLVVVDSGSVDQTARVAGETGARVLSREEVLPWLPVEQGKGEVLWRSLFATTSELVCFVDADLREFDAGLIPALLGPLFADPLVQLVKAAYERPLKLRGDAVTDKGGRVTELVARPLLQLHWPRLAGGYDLWPVNTPHGEACSKRWHFPAATAWSSPSSPTLFDRMD
jgi:glucosyl-3-phosphoglycerate synthase